MSTTSTVSETTIGAVESHDARLLAAVAPHDWVNPTSAPRYHLVVIGGGTAGLVCAAGAAGVGARVALIERQRLGGDCLNFGCVPSKSLLAASRAIAGVRRAREFGVSATGPVGIDFAAVMERLRRQRADLAVHDSVGRLRGLGIDVFLGAGKFVSQGAIEVGGQTLRFARAVIATGSRPTRPDIAGLHNAGCLTNESVFELRNLPAKLCVLGAGPIGCELAQAFARFGVAVTLLDRGGTILHKEDEDASAVLLAALRRDGVEVTTGTKIDRIEVTTKGKCVHMAHGAITVDEILVAAGRKPNVEELDLESAGVRYDPVRGVIVNDFLRTTNPRIYAAGDVCSRFAFTHAADAMARIVVQNALFAGWARVSNLVIPWSTYTSPELARVGLSEMEARARGIAVDVFTVPFTNVDRAVLDGETEGFAKVLLKKGTDRILGCTIVGEHAGELIAEVSVAMAQKMGLRRLGSAIRPYPTRAEVFRKLGDAYNRTRLTPWVTWVLRGWLSWL